MPTGYTQQIIDGTVKTLKEFLHLCLRNFGVCVSMRDESLNLQSDYTEYIKKFYQVLIDYHIKELKNAKAEYERIINLSYDELYEMYVNKFTDNREYYRKIADEAKKQNAQYQSFYVIMYKKTRLILNIGYNKRKNLRVGGIIWECTQN